MNDDTFVSSELTARASAELDEEVKRELEEDDPSPEKASAAINEAIENQDSDRQE